MTPEVTPVVGDDRLAEVIVTLQRAFTVALGPQLAADALAEALEYLAEHGNKIWAMESPEGYLCRDDPLNSPCQNLR